MLKTIKDRILEFLGFMHNYLIIRITDFRNRFKRYYEGYNLYETIILIVYEV